MLWAPVVASESQSGSKKPVGVEGVEPTDECSLQPQSPALVIWGQTTLDWPWLAVKSGQRRGVCWALRRVLKPGWSAGDCALQTPLHWDR